MTTTINTGTPESAAPGPSGGVAVAQSKFAIAASGTPDCGGPDRRRVLLIGVDGLRLDVLEQAPTPHLDRVLIDGCVTSSLIPTGTPTVSGPMWSSILSGMWAPDHGVMDNEVPPVAGRVPDVLSRMLHADPDSRVFAAASWRPLTVATECGPIIDPALVSGFSPDAGLYLDVQTADYSVARLDEHDDALRAAFIHFVEIDEAGHSHGIGAEYVEALLDVDAQVGRVLDALERRSDAHEWTVLMTTDHGHLDAGGHGGVSKAERLVWIGASDSQLARRLQTSCDIAPLMLELTAPLAASASVSVSPDPVPASS
jgi:predicted AlkP superfamily pyrophosphatase or phosphodiesterase